MRVLIAFFSILIQQHLIKGRVVGVVCFGGRNGGSGVLIQQTGEQVGDVIAPDAAGLFQRQNILLDESEQGIQLVAGIFQETDQRF